jgi:hypothetical protein
MDMAARSGAWLVADLADLPDDGNRCEVIDGELHVTPAPSLDHQEAVVRLYRFLTPYPEGAAEPLVIDVEQYFGNVLDS